MAFESLDTSPFSPRCVASTGDVFSRTVGEYETQSGSNRLGLTKESGAESNCFRSAHWSSDGTTILTQNEDGRLRAFVLPTELLDCPEQTLHLQPYATSSYAKTHATVLYPYYDLSTTSTTLLLQSRKDLPIRLNNTLDLDFSHASYPWIDADTEAFNAPHSLVFTSEGQHFVAGAKEKLAIFDISRSGEGPMMEMRTRAGRAERKLVGESCIGLAGLVSALSIGPDGTLAAGTTSRQVGLWSGSGFGENVASFSLSDIEEHGTKGGGVMQLAWSPCGRYLFVAERLSDALHVYDIRRAGKRISWIRGRRANTTQRLSFAISETSAGVLDVWSGGTDGFMRVWQDVTSREGQIDAEVEFKAHKDTVTSTIVHPGGTVFATTSGQRFDPRELVRTASSSGSDLSDEEDATGPIRTSENMLKVWTL